MKGTLSLGAGLLFGISTALAAEAASAPVTGRTNHASVLPPREQLRVYLLMGQSNMAGAAQIGDEDRMLNPRILRFSRSGQWEVAAEPIHNDRKLEAMGPAFSFARTMAVANPHITIGLVPCAVGGTPLSRWERGGDLYNKALSQARSAAQSGTLAGVLWHQGERDSISDNDTATYGMRLTNMICNLRADLRAPELPFVVGQLGTFLAQPKGKRQPRPLAIRINETLAGIPSQVPMTACVSSDGLRDKGDGVHFDTESQRDMGRRYATEMLRLQGIRN